MTYIIVYPNNTIKLLSLAKGVNQARALTRTMTRHPINSKVFDYDKPLPPAPTDAWVWDDQSQTIIIDESLIPINWAGLMADIMALDVELKMKLSYDYPSITQALIERDEVYLLRLIVSRETSLSDKDTQSIRDILTLHNVDLNQWITEKPF